MARAGRETRKKVPLLKKSQCSRAAVTVIAVFTTSCLFTMLSEFKKLLSHEKVTTTGQNEGLERAHLLSSLGCWIHGGLKERPISRRYQGPEDRKQTPEAEAVLRSTPARQAPESHFRKTVTRTSRP